MPEVGAAGARVEVQRGPQVVDARAEDVDEGQHPLQQGGPVLAGRRRRRIDHRQVERRGDPGRPGALQQRRQRRAPVGDQRGQQRRVADVEQVRAGQVHRGAVELGVGPDVMPERAVLPSGLEHERVGRRAPFEQPDLVGSRPARAKERHQQRAQLVVAGVAHHVDGGAQRRQVAAGVGHAAAGVHGERPDLQQLTRRRAGDRRELRDEVDADVTGDHDRAHRPVSLRAPWAPARPTAWGESSAPTVAR